MAIGGEQMTTTVPAVRAALVALLAAGLPDVQVIYGPATAEVTTGPSILVVGATVSGTPEPDSLTLGTYGERYRVDCAFSCTVEQPGDDGQQAAAELAWGYYAVAEVLIREHPTGDLGVPGVLGALPSGEFTATDTALPEGRNTTIEWSVNVIAQRT